MARITIEDCLARIPNRFELTLAATNRARQITAGSAPMVESDRDKPTVIALREMAAGKPGLSRRSAAVRPRQGGERRRRRRSPRAAPQRLLSAQTAWIGSPPAPPPEAGAAQDGVRAGRDGPHRDCNHIDLPLGTGRQAGLPKRTRYVVA